ncbi:hypothetical protein Hhel01_02102 [Haloferula helveola]
MENESGACGTGRSGEYREAASEAIAGLAARIAEEIRENGPIGFDRFMGLALYDPAGGYYARRTGQVGREGDFFTSVSAGPLFGLLIARHLTQFWEDCGRPDRWRVLELGAHDGRLAEDILDHLPEDALAALEYAILEPLPKLAAAQAERLGDRVRIAGDAGDLEPLPGMLVANEVLDALPCRLVESDGSEWNELGVACEMVRGLRSASEEASRFTYQSLGPAAPLTESLPLRPAGYRTEVRDNFESFLKPLSGLVQRMLWFDYGFERDDYYADSRAEGTLRTFHKHRADDNPLQSPGELDITAHVDFTAFREAVEACGGQVIRFENQSRFLTEVGREWLLSLEGRTDPDALKLVRNFQTLTHPGQLGSRFHVMEARFD